MTIEEAIKHEQEQDGTRIEQLRNIRVVLCQDLVQNKMRSSAG